MAASRTVAEFDEIAPVYDETREPIEPPQIRTIAETLRGWGIDRLLEIGVGTGRVALPLASERLEVTGVDASRGMLSRARAKGVRRLVRGSAYRLPFAAGAVDGALFVHVLHLLEDPVAALGEACRVARIGAAALVRPPGGERPDRGGELSPQRLVFDRLREMGVDLPERGRGGPGRKEAELLTEHPPQRTVVVHEADVTAPLAEGLTMFERRASRWTLRVPPEKLARAVAEARERLGDRTHTYHRVWALALWERPPERVAAASAIPPP
jgi:SAM-dependent methyltransferase